MVKVSIIVPTYNVEIYARQCFDSLLGQTLKEIEIILVDDGSTDSSGSICDEYAKADPRITVIHQTNRGLGLSRNSGLEIARGEYIGFLDSDDCVASNMFRVLYENAKEYDADISYCAYKKFTDGSELADCEEEGQREVRVWSGDSAIRQYMLDRIGLPPASKEDNSFGASVCCGIFRRERLMELNAKFISERQFISEDMIFDIDVIPRCRTIVYCDLPLHYYRYNPASLTTVYKPDRFEENVKLYHEMYRRLEGLYTHDELFNSMSRYLLTTARIAVIQEARFIEKVGKRKAKENILRICRNSELERVLSRYHYNRLPLKYAVICWMQKKHLAGLLLLAVRIYLH